MQTKTDLEVFKDYMKRGWNIKDISQIHLTHVSPATLTRWKKQYFYNRSPWTNQKRHFKKHYPLTGKPISVLAHEYGVTRQTLTKWKNELFPELKTKELLFIKLIEKQTLTNNEISVLLSMTETSVKRLMRNYKAYKMQGITTTATTKRKAKAEKYNQLEIMVYSK
jgi:transposase-like protein